MWVGAVFIDCHDGRMVGEKIFLLKKLQDKSLQRQFIGLPMRVNLGSSLIEYISGN